MKNAASAPAPAPLAIGVIADTHGVLSAAVPAIFADVVHIIHAGDVGKRAVLHKLEKIAPVTAISGNADSGRLAASLPTQATVEIAGVRVFVIHKPKAAKRYIPGAYRDGVRLIVTGHLHEPGFFWEDGVLHVNPGSATAPEEGDPQPTVAIVTLRRDGLGVCFIPVPRPVPASAKPRAKRRTKSTLAPTENGKGTAEKAERRDAGKGIGTTKGSAGKGNGKSTGDGAAGAVEPPSPGDDGPPGSDAAIVG
ncbi:MAG: metallophosphoesterase family protein [Thermoleophilia bacterium]